MPKTAKVSNIKDSDFGFKPRIEFAPIGTEMPEYIPASEPDYCFDENATNAIIAAFMHNRKLLMHGLHGSGKSTHIEQVAARLQWPLMRVNLDGHIGRFDLIGRDSIIIKDDKQVTEFAEGIIPWAMQNGVALLFDEYDAARPEILFVLQRVLESEGKLTLLEQNRVIKAHPNFRLFATANTVGLGDQTGIYHGTNPINQGQMDRWHMIVALDYPKPEKEFEIIISKLKSTKIDKNLKATIKDMIKLAHLTRTGFKDGNISTIISPRTIISWAENMQILGVCEKEAFKLTFFNRCDEDEKKIIAEYYQRVFAHDIF